MTRPTPRVSVVIPNYNHAPYLRQRLDTVLGQSFGDIEIIFLDDASTDDSIQVFEAYSSDPRMRYEFNSENSGSPFRQWNKGISMARGEYIWIAESDDFSAPRFLESLVRALDEHPSATVAYSQSMIVLDNGEEHSFLEWYGHLDNASRWEGDYCSDGLLELSKYFLFQNIIPNASAALFRRTLPKLKPRAPEHMHLCGDWLFWAQLACQGDICYVARPLNYFRQSHGQSQRSRTAAQALEVTEGFEVYKFISRQVEIDPTTRSKLLLQQIKRWAAFEYEQKLDPETQVKIRSAILEAHPEAAQSMWRRIKLPFAYYYLAVPLKRFHFVATTYGRLRQAIRWLLRRRGAKEK